MDPEPDTNIYQEPEMNTTESEIDNQATEEFMEAVETVINEKPKSITYKCEVCNRQFKKEELYGDHRLAQTCIPVNQRTNCIRCGLFFATRAELASHILTPDHRAGINSYIKTTIEAKANRSANAGRNSRNSTGEKSRSKAKSLNNVDILNSIDVALTEEERQQIKNIIKNSSANSATSNTNPSHTTTSTSTKNKVPALPDNTLKITFNNGQSEVYENFMANVQQPQPQVPQHQHQVPQHQQQVTQHQQQVQQHQQQVQQPEQQVQPRPQPLRPSAYQNTVLNFLKVNAEKTDRKDLFYKLLLNSKKKHQDAFNGFVKLISRVSSLSPEAKADYIAAMADFEAYLIGLAARGQKLYNDMEIFELVSQINSAAARK